MNVIGIIVLLIIVFGGIHALIRIKYHNKLLDKKTYRIKMIDLVAKLYISIPFLILTFFFTSVLIQRIFTDNYFYAFGLVLPILFGLLSIPSLILFKQYYKVEKNRLIELDPDKRQLIIKTNDKEIIIDNSDIKLVEYFKATPDKGPYDFEYLKMTLNDGSKYILTNLLNDLSDFEPIFKGVKRRYNKMRIFNKINWG